MVSIIIIILWDHRHMCGPSLTETSLCSAYLNLVVTAVFVQKIATCFSQFTVIGLSYNIYIFLRPFYSVRSHKFTIVPL